MVPSLKTVDHFVLETVYLKRNECVKRLKRENKGKEVPAKGYKHSQRIS